MMVALNSWLSWARCRSLRCSRSSSFSCSRSLSITAWKVATANAASVELPVAARRSGVLTPERRRLNRRRTTTMPTKITARGTTDQARILVSRTMRSLAGGSASRARHGARQKLSGARP